jgi:aryl-phospho-beta-D-glucosidase BglC (GH1 family)
LHPVEPILGLLEQAIDGLTSAGLDVIFDLHKCPGHDFHAGARHAQEFFSSPVKREESLRVWKYIAERFGGRTNVALELLNEPVAEESSAWDKVKDELSAHIRRFAPRSKLVVGSNRWNNPKEFDHLTPLHDDNVVYSFHYYSPILFTHQLAPWLDGDVFQVRRPYPADYAIAAGTTHRLPLEGGRWDRGRMERDLESVFRFREKHQVPIACNEFGVFVGGADRASQLNWMRDFVTSLDEHGIGFSYWNYKNLDFGLVSRGERAFADYPQYANAERVDHELAAILQRA